jgi:hypothetical protein
MSITRPLNNQNAYHLSTFKNETIIYSASSWTDNSQYLSAHSSKYMYQEDNLSKKIGGRIRTEQFFLLMLICFKVFFYSVSKSFVRFLEANEKLFLFQNEYSYDVDDGEKDRDILVAY